MKRLETAAKSTGRGAATEAATPARPGDDMEAMWSAVRDRDASRDGEFCYAVATTGIYCRPSCPSRRPRRENVSFFETGAAAEAAGYRACKRCRPGGGGRHAAARLSPEHRQRARLVADACRIIECAEDPPTLGVLAHSLGLSPHQVHRLFKTELGITPKAYATALRRRRLADGLERSGTVTAAAHGAGFGSSGRFYAAAMETLGMTPRAYRAGGAGDEIRFAVGQTTLGALLVAESRGGTTGARGICAILLGDEPGALVRDLQDRFPNATLIGADPGFEEVVAMAAGLVERPGSAADLPLDIRGTAFQERVWQALRQIPPGRTASYAEIARAVGRPLAARAVAAACAANPLAVAIPCHRVVRSDGDLSGYRWGIERKRALLARESKG